MTLTAQSGGEVRQKLLAGLSQTDTESLNQALMNVVVYEADRTYAESIITMFLTHSNPQVRAVAAAAIDYLVRTHGKINKPRIVPLIEELLKDTRTMVNAQSALTSINTLVK